MALVLTGPGEFFGERVEDALRKLKFRPKELAKRYVVNLLERFMVSSRVFERGETLAELYLRALGSPKPLRHEMLKKLGDGSLYISGFFGESLQKKLVDIDYYVDMGGSAFATLAGGADGELAETYADLARQFGDFVEVLAFISQDVLVKSNGDLLRLYDRWLSTGSRLAEGQLVEKGLLCADLPKARAHKM